MDIPHLPAAQIELDTAAVARAIEAGAIKEAIHTQERLATTGDLCNPSIFRVGGYIVILSLFEDGSLLAEAASADGREGGHLRMPKEAVPLKYSDLVRIGDSKPSETRMLRVCRDGAGKLSLAYGEAPPVPTSSPSAGETKSDDGREFTKLLALIRLAPANPQQLYTAVARYRAIRQQRARSCPRELEGMFHTIAMIRLIGGLGSTR